MNQSRKKLLPIENSVSRDARSKCLSKIVATVSGGADSVALLHALHAAGVRMVAVHCNFHLRGEESMRDQRHTERLCRKLGVELLVKDFNIATYINNGKGISVEMACRKLRYEWFDEVAASAGADRIATGHNADDNIETFFLNLLRGAGTSGLKGMLPDNGKIWRPLLGFHRSEILSYLEERGVEFVTDSTNLESDYRRNFLRNDVIPLLRGRWPGFDKALDRSISLVRNENRVVVAAVEKALPPAGDSLHAETVMAFPDPELLVRRFIEPASPFTTTAGEIISAIKADKPDSRTWRLRHGKVELRNRKLRLEIWEE